MGFINNLLNRWKNKDNQRLADMAAQLRQSKLETNNFKISNANAQSWAPDLHPNGREDSSWVASYDYDGNTKQLSVTYRDGATCIYDDIDESMAKEFNSADSKGRWVAHNLAQREYH